MSDAFYENVRCWESKDDFRLWVLEGGVRKPYRPHMITIILEKELEIWKMDTIDNGSRLYFHGKYNTRDELDRALLFAIPSQIVGEEYDIYNALNIIWSRMPGEFVFD